MMMMGKKTENCMLTKLMMPLIQQGCLTGPGPVVSAHLTGSWPDPCTEKIRPYSDHEAGIKGISWPWLVTRDHLRLRSRRGGGDLAYDH